MLVDPTDPGTSPRMLFFLEQAIHDARGHTISREVHFVETNEQGQVGVGGNAPYLDYRPATEAELETLTEQLGADWLSEEALESQVINHAIEEQVPRHLERVRTRHEELIDKTLSAVQERLTKEINYWDRRAHELRQVEKSGKVNQKLNSKLAEQRADDLAARLKRRKEELELERQISATPPVVIGGTLIVPAGLVYGEHTPPEIMDTRITEAIAMQAVMDVEADLGNHPIDVSHHNLGYDIESLDPDIGRLRFIEVKGRRAGADTVTLTRNEILTAINSPEQFILAIVEVADGQGREPRYVRKPAFSDPGFGATSVNYNLLDLLNKSVEPS